jgi:hypothetical protein
VPDNYCGEGPGPTPPAPPSPPVPFSDLSGARALDLICWFVVVVVSCVFCLGPQACCCIGLFHFALLRSSVSNFQLQSSGREGGRQGGQSDNGYWETGLNFPMFGGFLRGKKNPFFPNRAVKKRVNV